MAIVVLRNKANPNITRQFPAGSWKVIDKNSKLKKEWELSHSLDGSDISEQVVAPKTISFIPPEVEKVMQKGESANKKPAAEKPKTKSKPTKPIEL